MAKIVTNGNVNINAVNGFYRIEAANGDGNGTSGLVLTTARSQAVTFANAGNCLGFAICLYGNAQNDREVLVELQEDTGGGSWVTRASHTLTSAEIIGTLQSGTYAGRGKYLIAHDFDAPYAVDTTASKWRLQCTQTGGTTGNWYWYRGEDNSTMTYFLWCDNAVSYVDDTDQILVKDYLTINADTTLKGVVDSGMTIMANCMWVCSNPAFTSDQDIGFLRWEDNPASSHTLTIRGQIPMFRLSGLRVGTTANPIAYSAQAKILFAAPAAGTMTYSFTTHGGSPTTTYSYGCQTNIYMHGEVPTVETTTITGDIAVGGNTLTTADATGWAIGDTFVIGKRDVQGQGGSTVIHTITNISGTSITFSGNLATAKALAGAHIFRIGEKSGYGIYLGATGTPTVGDFHGFGLYRYMKGVAGYRFRLYALGAATYDIEWAKAFASEYRPIHTYTNCSFAYDATSLYYFYYGLISENGLLFNNIFCHRGNIDGALHGAYFANYKSGRATYQNCGVISNYAGTINTPGYYTNKVTIKNSWFENGAGTFYRRQGIDWEDYGNFVWGCSDAEGAVQVGQIINPLDIHGNTYAYNDYAIGLSTFVCKGATEYDATFDSAKVNEYDIAPTANCSNEYTFKDAVYTTPTIYETNRADASSLMRIAYDTPNSTNEYFSLWNTANIRKAGYGLTDTTTHTTGGHSMRINYIGDFTVSSDIPTGDISGKTMNINIWVKINTANYYGGLVYTLPTLSVAYDEASVATATATASTDWQLLSVAVSPTTDKNKVVMSLLGGTDASDADAYVYWADASVNYPAGYTLNLGSLESWGDGIPAQPYISTSFGVNDILNAKVNGFTDKTTLAGKIQAGLNTGTFIALG